MFIAPSSQRLHSWDPNTAWIQRGIAGLEQNQGQRCWQSGKTIVQLMQTYANGKMQFKLFECTWCRLVELQSGVAYASAQDDTNIQIYTNLIYYKCNYRWLLGCGRNERLLFMKSSPNLYQKAHLEICGIWIRFQLQEKASCRSQAICCSLWRIHSFPDVRVEQRCDKGFHEDPSSCKAVKLPLPFTLLTAWHDGKGSWIKKLDS